MKYLDLYLEAGPEPIRFLELWYREQSRSDDYSGGRISIETVDGPGWWITVDIEGTSLAGRSVAPILLDSGSGRWLQTWCDGTSFTVATSACHMADGLAEFRRFALDSDPTPYRNLLST